MGILAWSFCWSFLALNLSCTRLRVPPVALHVSQLISWILERFAGVSTGVALHPLKISVSHLSPPPVPGGVAPIFGSEKVSRYTGVSQLQLRVSRYTVQLSSECPSKISLKTSPKTSPQTSPRTAPLQNAEFVQNFALQKPFANAIFGVVFGK